MRERERERVNGASRRKGIPIGNLTSQLFANVYMNEFDQFAKHVLKIKYYARYTDDFVIVSNAAAELEQLLLRIEEFLSERLRLSLHPSKISIRTYAQGIDFLGQVIFPHHRLLRTKTKRRVFSKLERRVEQCKSGLISEDALNQSLQSYLGVLSHVNGYRASEKLQNEFWFGLNDR